jgi:hypothetical protein
MTTHIPTCDDLRVVLGRLRHGDLQRLSRVSGVPFSTLWKVRIGETPNPRIGTVRAFWPHAVRLAETVEAA